MTPAVGDLVSLPGSRRFWVLLRTSRRETLLPPDTLCGFGGLWYGNDPWCQRCYGKAIEIDADWRLEGHIGYLPLDVIRALVE